MSRQNARDWWSYQADKVLPKPAYERLPPSKEAPKPEEVSSGIDVQESLMDTVRMKAWKWLGP